MKAILRLLKRKGYQWPASALTAQEMEILYTARKETGVAICELLRQAVESITHKVGGNGDS